GRDEHPTLASGIADAAAAQLLIFDELPEDERPASNDRALLVGIVWGGTTLVELEQVVEGGDLTVSRLFDLPESTLPRNFHLVKHARSGHVVTFPDEIRAEVHSGGRIVPLGMKGQRVDAPFRGHAYTIGRDDRVVAQITPSATPEPPKVKEASGAKEGEKSKGAEGKLGKREAKKKEAAPSRPGADPDKKAKDQAKIRKLGLIAALSKMGVTAGGGGLPGPGGL